ncbi:MAG: hypothetical protein KA244_10550, partial [Deltaproteobacteria bacterium]|nr:hypothetical protein [Deltaproteobacteria bacterium]
MRVATLAVACLAPAWAWAVEVSTIPCGPVEDNTIHIDGLLSDWEGVSPIILKVEAGASATARSLTVKISCNYDAKSLYLLADV